MVCGGKMMHFPECIMTDVVLEIKNLTRRFNAFTAVDALTFSSKGSPISNLAGFACGKAEVT
jgi:ABC-type uncharacterized transport system ATPase subunit